MLSTKVKRRLESGQTPRLREAYLVDVAEIGAALGSGDVELAHEIDRSAVPSTGDRRTTSCIVELLEGGALFDHDAQFYVDAFALICRHFGEQATAAEIHALDGAARAQVPFDIPSDSATTSLVFVGAADVEASMGEGSQGRSLLLFSSEQ